MWKAVVHGWPFCLVTLAIAAAVFRSTLGAITSAWRFRPCADTALTSSPGNGRVTFGADTIRTYPEWWGAKGDGKTDDSAAVQVGLPAQAAKCGHLQGLATMQQLECCDGTAGRNAWQAMMPECASPGEPPCCAVPPTTSCMQGLSTSFVARSVKDRASTCLLSMLLPCRRHLMQPQTRALQCYI